MILFIGNIVSSLGEADTITLSVYVLLRWSGDSNLVVVDVEDMVVYIQVTAISHDIPGILCIQSILLQGHVYVFICLHSTAVFLVMEKTLKIKILSSITSPQSDDA